MAEINPIVVMGVAGKVVDLPVAQGPATGYSWVLDLPPGVVRVEDAPAKQSDHGKLLGASASGSMRVVAPKGNFRLTARLVRPWEPANPAATMLIDLVIG